MILIYYDINTRILSSLLDNKQFIVPKCMNERTNVKKRKRNCNHDMHSNPNQSHIIVVCESDKATKSDREREREREGDRRQLYKINFHLATSNNLPASCRLLLTDILFRFK